MKENIISKNIMRTLAVVLIISMIFTQSLTVTYASENTSSVSLLSALGVITPDSSGNYNLNTNVTRGEFAKMLISLSPYKDNVSSVSASSPFKDVKASDWEAPYVKLAASNGLISGYSDGNFKPDTPITIEQAVNAVLRLLGYTQEDFKGSFPYAQMNIYNSCSLSNGISKSTGSYITKGDGANLLYNMLNMTMKDDTKKYAETIGYTLNSSGTIDYADVVSTNMNGPYTVTSSSWYTNLGLSINNLTIYKNGNTISSSEVNNYDIVYYSNNKSVAWVYDDKVVGVYEKASPSQNDVTSVTISGKEYALESSEAFTALSSSGGLSIGSTITLLLGKNGGVADAVSSTVYNESVVLYVTESGTKTYQNSSGEDYSSKYIKGITSNGAETEYPITKTIDAGAVAKVSFNNDGSMNVNQVSTGGFSGICDPGSLLIGNRQILSNAVILDVYKGSYALIAMDRLDGLTLNASDVIYYQAENGKITFLVLDNITGDISDYGILTSAERTTSSDLSSSGSYEYLLNGITTTLTTQNTTYGVAKGPAEFLYDNNKIDSMKNLSKLSTKITTLNINNAVTVDKSYSISGNVSVYQLSSGKYLLSSMSSALEAFNQGKALSYYYDSAKGSQIRIIIIPE